MVLWHLPFALSGQTWSGLNGGTLSFAPKVPAPFKVTWMVPGAAGIFSSVGGKEYELVATMGSVAVSHLTVFGKHCAASGTVAPGSPLKCTTA